MELQSLRRVSAALAFILDSMKSIGPEETVAFRRKRNEILYYTTTLADSHKCIYSGSKGEGYNFSTSDVDLMYVCRQTLVFDSTQDIDVIDGPYETKLLMRRDNCNPGFVILQLLNRTCNQEIRNSIVKYNYMRVVSSLFYRDTCNSSVAFDATGHGPCSSGSIQDLEFDMAFCFECKIWPTEAYEFIHRNRHYQWPFKNMLDEIIERGCHVVAIGDKDSDISHIQWRLSFSVAEKLLMYSLNHTQFKVYGLLKIFLKQVIDKEERVKGVLCSYFLKTALFYSIESTPASFWRDDLIILCFWFCFNKLFKWVIRGYCPNYFVPRNNMFRNKIHGETQRSIASALYKYKCVGWTCLCQCEDFRVLQEVNKSPNHIDNFIPKDLGTELKLISTLFFPGEEVRYMITNPDFMKKRILRRCLTLLAHPQSRGHEDIIIVNVRDVLQEIGKAFYSKQYNGVDRLSNKYLYVGARKSELFLLMCSGADISMGPLTLATSYYFKGQYNKAIPVIKTLVSRLKPFFFVSDTDGNVEHLRFYLRKRGLDQRPSNIMKRVFALKVVITPTSKHMYPSELKHDIEETITFKLLAIPPLQYSLFLLFLCHHKLGEIDNSFSALHDLKVLVNDETHDHDYIEYNMLAVCLEKLGDTRGAVDACLQSIKLRPKKNGAYRLIDKIISCR